MAIKYWPPRQDETARRDRFVAIDRAPRWGDLRIDAEPSEARRTDFLRRLKRKAPIQIVKLLTDHGRPFTARFIRKNKTPSDPHTCDHECALLGIEQRLTKPRPADPR